MNKHTNEEVVVKTICKEDMNDEDLYQQKLEFEILKVCQHPNVIHMKDYYEDADNIYIILDYLKGRDLYDYMKYRNSKMTEERAKLIA